MVALRKILSRTVSRLWQPATVPLPALETLVQSYSAEPAPRILYFGDSVVERVATEDVDKRTIPAMLGDRLNDPASVLGLSHSAFHPGVYQAVLRCFERLAAQPQIVIIPINLRCFSPQWDLEPAYQFRQEIRVLEAFADGGKGPHRVASSKPKEQDYVEFDRTPLSYPNSELTSVGQFRALMKRSPATESDDSWRRQQIFTFFYMNELKAEHRKLRALRACVEFLNHRGIQPLLYLTPINFETAIEHVGEQFDKVHEVNTNLLAAQLGSIAPFFDWSRALDPSFFFHARLHTEHLRETGRVWLVEQLASRLPG